jgi:hypothetical protein
MFHANAPLQHHSATCRLPKLDSFQSIVSLPPSQCTTFHHGTDHAQQTNTPLRFADLETIMSTSSTTSASRAHLIKQLSARRPMAKSPSPASPATSQQYATATVDLSMSFDDVLNSTELMPQYAGINTHPKQTNNAPRASQSLRQHISPPSTPRQETTMAHEPRPAPPSRRLQPTMPRYMAADQKDPQQHLKRQRAPYQPKPTATLSTPPYRSASTLLAQYRESPSDSDPSKELALPQAPSQKREKSTKPQKSIATTSKRPSVSDPSEGLAVLPAPSPRFEKSTKPQNPIITTGNTSHYEITSSPFARSRELDDTVLHHNMTMNSTSSINSTRKIRNTRFTRQAVPTPDAQPARPMNKKSIPPVDPELVKLFNVGKRAASAYTEYDQMSVDEDFLRRDFESNPHARGFQGVGELIETHPTTGQPIVPVTRCTRRPLSLYASKLRLQGEEKEIFSYIHTLKYRVDQLELDKSEAAQKQREYENEILHLRGQLAASQRRPDSGFGSSDEEEGNWKKEKMQYQAALQEMKGHLDRSEREKAVAETTVTRLTEERDELYAQHQDYTTSDRESENQTEQHDEPVPVLEEREARESHIKAINIDHESEQPQVSPATSVGDLRDRVDEERQFPAAEIPQEDMTEDMTGDFTEDLTGDVTGDVSIATIRPSQPPKAALETVLAQLQAEINELNGQLARKQRRYRKMDPTVSKRRRGEVEQDMARLLSEIQKRSDQAYALTDVGYGIEA